AVLTVGMNVIAAVSRDHDEDRASGRRVCGRLLGHAHAGPACAHAASTHATTATAPAATAFAPVAAGRAGGAGRALKRDLQVRRYRRQVERGANEVAQRDHEFVELDGLAGKQFAGRTLGKPNLFLRTQQHYVGECRLDGVAYSPGAVRSRRSAAGR